MGPASLPSSAALPAVSCGTVLVAAMALRSSPQRPDTHARPAAHCVLRWQVTPRCAVGSEQPSNKPKGSAHAQPITRSMLIERIQKA